MQRPQPRRRLLLASKLLLLMALFTLLDLNAAAQTSQLLPEIDVYYKLQPELRIWFQAKGTREGGSASQAEIGPSLDWYVKPWVKLKDVTAFDFDDSKTRLLVLSVGYRYLPSANSPPENRLEPIVTMNFPLKGKLLLSDRNRADLDWQSGSFSWRYRNRISLERALPIQHYHFIPYVMAELFYESQYGKWSDTAIYAGCLLPIGKHVQFNPYYEHQNNTGKSPNQQLNQLGLMLNLFF